MMFKVLNSKNGIKGHLGQLVIKKNKNDLQ